MNWDGASWRHIKLPPAIEGIAAMTQDGHGGLWLLANTNLDSVNLPQQYWYHYHSGRWTRRAARSPSGYHLLTVFGMAWIPRTTGVWAVGGAFLKHASAAVIELYGPRNPKVT